MPDGAGWQMSKEARIGPNAILQLRAPMDSLVGPCALDALLARCGVELPDGRGMIPQSDVARVHHAVYALYPTKAHDIAVESGRGTARYIRANRIPAPACCALGILPRRVSEHALTKAILAHAWTFCGSGHVTAKRIAPKIIFRLADNPLVYTHAGSAPQCHWHCAVFAELFSILLRRPYSASETACCGAGAAACEFHVQPV